MVSKDNLGDRMKRYEAVTSTRLVSRLPVIMRLDGKAFHTFTKGFEKPFDEVFSLSMRETMKYLCENIQGCLFGYTQSDEITLLLQDYKEVNTCSWFDYKVHKMVSIGASMATFKFNERFSSNALHAVFGGKKHIYHNALERGAFFDARVFNVPFEDVVNNFIWRQQDAIRNAISAIGQATYTHKELQGKSTKDIIWMLENDGNSIMNYPLKYLRGSACYKGVEERYSEYAGDFITRNVWKIDEEIPIFSEVRNFIPLR